MTPLLLLRKSSGLTSRLGMRTWSRTVRPWSRHGAWRLPHPRSALGLRQPQIRWYKSTPWPIRQETRPLRCCVGSWTGIRCCPAWTRRRHAPLETSPRIHHGRSSQPTSRRWQPCCAMRQLCQCRLLSLHTWPLLRPRDATAHRAWPWRWHYHRPRAGLRGRESLRPPCVKRRHVYDSRSHRTALLLRTPRWPVLRSPRGPGQCTRR